MWHSLSSESSHSCFIVAAFFFNPVFFWWGTSFSQWPSRGWIRLRCGFWYHKPWSHLLFPLFPGSTPGFVPSFLFHEFQKKTNFVFSIHVSWGLFDSCSPLFDMFCIIWHTILGWVQNYQEHPSLPAQACFFTHSLTICHCFWNLKIYIGCFLCWWSLKHFFCLWGAHSSWLVTHGKLWASFLFWLPTLGVALIVLNNSS